MYTYLILNGSRILWNCTGKKRRVRGFIRTNTNCLTLGILLALNHEKRRKGHLRRFYRFTSLSTFRSYAMFTNSYENRFSLLFKELPILPVHRWKTRASSLGWGTTKRSSAVRRWRERRLCPPIAEIPTPVLPRLRASPTILRFASFASRWRDNLIRDLCSASPSRERRVLWLSTLCLVSFRSFIVLFSSLFFFNEGSSETTPRAFQSICTCQWS